MRLLLFLLLLLQASLVNWQGGFPAGSLITVYFLHLPLPGDSNWVAIDLWEDYEARQGRFHFRLDDKREQAAVVSNVMVKEADGWGGEAHPLLWFPEESYPPKTEGDWWRFDLYKINETAYVPFFQGFRQVIRTMAGVRDSTSFSIRPHVSQADSYNTDEVSVHFHPLNKQSLGKPEMTLDSFPNNAELKLSVMMVSYHNIDEPFRPEPKLYFYAKDEAWTFGLETIWDQSNRSPNLRLFTRTNGANKNDKEVPCVGTNADLVHARLERVGSAIKARINYKDGWPERYECEMDVGVEAAKHLDGPLMTGDYFDSVFFFVSRMVVVGIAIVLRSTTDERACAGADEDGNYNLHTLPQRFRVARLRAGLTHAALAHSHVLPVDWRWIADLELGLLRRDIILPYVARLEQWIASVMARPPASSPPIEEIDDRCDTTQTNTDRSDRTPPPPFLPDEDDSDSEANGEDGEEGEADA